MKKSHITTAITLLVLTLVIITSFRIVSWFVETTIPDTTESRKNLENVTTRLVFLLARKDNFKQAFYWINYVELSINITDPAGQTLLHHAVRQGNKEAVTKLLFMRIDDNIKDENGFTALDIAKKHNQKGIIQILKKPPPTRSNTTRVGLYLST